MNAGYTRRTLQAGDVKVVDEGVMGLSVYIGNVLKLWMSTLGEVEGF